jgi:ParB-like chromosome segregation protein Spo0J
MSAAPYQLFPALTPDEKDALAKDIAERGVLVPVEVDENGVILDGHHRAMIADSLGIEYPTVTRTGMTEAEKLEHVFALNLARRQLNSQTRALVIALCRERGMSLRAIAGRLDVSHETVRNDLKGRAVKDLTPDCAYSEPEPKTPEPEPALAIPTRAERARELAEAGLTQDAIAAGLGVSQATVYGLLSADPRRRVGADIPVEWSHTKALLADIKALPARAPAPRLFAQTVPARNRASAARTLRQVGTLLGSIAHELERSIG